MSTVRRSLSDTLTSAQQAFLTVAEAPQNTQADATEVLPEPSLNSQRPPPRIALTARRITKTGLAVGPVLRPEPLRSVTLRLRASTADALRRESIQRSLNYIQPFSQQAIVEAAVSEWLRAHGCCLGDQHIV